MQSFTSVPFKTESGHGLTQVNGVAKFSSAGVVFEFESKLFGLISNGVREVRLSTADILDIKFKKGVFKRGAKIVIRTTSVAKLSELPNSEGKMTLKIQSDDFVRASSAVERLNEDINSDANNMRLQQPPASIVSNENKDDVSRTHRY